MSKQSQEQDPSKRTLSLKAEEHLHEVPPTSIELLSMMAFLLETKEFGRAYGSRNWDVGDGETDGMVNKDEECEDEEEA